MSVLEGPPTDHKLRTSLSSTDEEEYSVLFPYYFLLLLLLETNVEWNVLGELHLNRPNFRSGNNNNNKYTNKLYPPLFIVYPPKTHIQCTRNHSREESSRTQHRRGTQEQHKE